MQIIIEPDGLLRCIYTEDIDLAALGSPTITRASHVEPDQQGRWQADLTPVSGPVLTGFAHRSEALAAEHAWLETHWLCRDDPAPRGPLMLKCDLALIKWRVHSGRVG
jgi:hypothetical protein